jgi:Ca2+-binding EF-hand superfamily protein
VDAKKIIELFDFFDSNKDGKLDLSDFITILEHYDKIPVKHSFTYKKKGKK